MAKSWLIEKTKNSPLLYNVYRNTMTIVVNTMKLFTRTDNSLILFVSYGGRYFNDSPKCIYEAMKTDKRFKNYKLVWAFRNPSDFEVERKVRIDTIRYFSTALKARCWVTNTVVERGLNFIGKNTYYFHTTHGTLPKHSGNDEHNTSVFRSKYNHKYNCSCAQSEEEKKLQQGMFGLEPDQIIVCGYPKNDVLANPTIEERNKVLDELHIPRSKKVILYAPTFREKSMTEYTLPVDFQKWADLLGSDYVILFRTHPVIAKKTDVNVPGFVFDVSSYPDNMGLMIASDYLISDYSGIFFEFAILDRPMFCFAYDYKEYIMTRGLYMDLREELPSGDEDDIIAMILHPERFNVMDKVKTFKEKYVSEFGHATERAVDNIYNHIKMV